MRLFFSWINTFDATKIPVTVWWNQLDVFILQINNALYCKVNTRYGYQRLAISYANASCREKEAQAAWQSWRIILAVVEIHESLASIVHKCAFYVWSFKSFFLYNYKLTFTYGSKLIFCRSECGFDVMLIRHDTIENSLRGRQLPVHGPR